MRGAIDTTVHQKKSKIILGTWKPKDFLEKIGEKKPKNKKLKKYG